MTENQKRDGISGWGCVGWAILVFILVLVLAVLGVWYWVHTQFISYTMPLKEAQVACGDPQPRSGPFDGIVKLQEYYTKLEQIDWKPGHAVPLDLSAEDVRDVIEATFHRLAGGGAATSLSKQETADSVASSAKSSEQLARFTGLSSLFAFDKAGVRAALHGDQIELCLVVPLSSPISSVLGGEESRALTVQTKIFIFVGNGKLELTFREAVLNGKPVDSETLTAFDQGFGAALFEGKSEVSELVRTLVDSLSVVDNRVRIISHSEKSKE
jgi:hypothetical protein